MHRTLALIPLLILGSAYAAEGPAPATGHRGPDANHDGVISREEARAFPRLAGEFDSWDTNKDGQLDAAEMQAHRDERHREMREHAIERWKAADTNSDGAIELAEAQQGMPRLAERFATVDSNHDGKVTPDELRAARHEARSE